ncbi:MAG: hypothetical protein NTX66_01505 [Candidatus Falkowbacteria bacterium]|nr:hypothetical protein [Candidatus Falkowbacteria bacterium]
MISTLKSVNAKTLAEIDEEKRLRRTEEIFLLFPLGSQFDHLIKQALDALGVFCLVVDTSQIKATDVATLNPRGIILSGGPASVIINPPAFDTKIFDLKIPVLGICLGFQLWAQHIGCLVVPADKREFGTHRLTSFSASGLFKDCDLQMPVLENHGDRVEKTEKSLFRFCENRQCLGGRR